jgi:hypothetical protein
MIIGYTFKQTKKFTKTIPPRTMKPYYVLLLTYGNKIDVDRIRCRMEYGTGTIGIDGKVEGKWREVGIVEEYIKDRPGVGSITL